LLNEPEEVSKDDEKPYTIFTPFMKKARQNSIRKPTPNIHSNFYIEEVKLAHQLNDYRLLFKHENPNLLPKGGRSEALSLLQNLNNLHNYDNERNLPSVKGTSLLSAHHKFGTISVRETYWKIANELGVGHTLVNELYWRDFFTHIVWHFPHVLGQAYNAKYAAIQWENDKAKFEKWCKGQTGFPIVDAGMRELTTSGFMHNRVRMIVASFLTKDLHIDWRWG